MTAEQGEPQSMTDRLGLLGRGFPWRNISRVLSGESWAPDMLSEREVLRSSKFRKCHLLADISLLKPQGNLVC